MWFDAKAALAKLKLEQPATSATNATRDQCHSGTLMHHPVANVAAVAAPGKPAHKLRGNTGATAPLEPAVKSDAQIYFDLIQRTGPISYGAAARMLNWGATRAWQAQKKLKEQRCLNFDNLGRAKIARPSEVTSPHPLPISDQQTDDA